jgi:hypothetical protein
MHVFSIPDGMDNLASRLQSIGRPPVVSHGGMTSFGGGLFEPTTAYSVGISRGMGQVEGYLGKNAF